MIRAYRPRVAVNPVVIGMDMVEEARQLERLRMLVGLDAAIVSVEALEFDDEHAPWKRAAINGVKRKAVSEMKSLRNQIAWGEGGEGRL